MIRTSLRPLARILRAREKAKTPTRSRLRTAPTSCRKFLEQRAPAAGWFHGDELCCWPLAPWAPRWRCWPQPADRAAHPNHGRPDHLAARRHHRPAGAGAGHQPADLFALRPSPARWSIPRARSAKLVKIFPDLDIERLKKDFSGKRSFVWIKKRSARTDAGRP